MLFKTLTRTLLTTLAVVAASTAAPQTAQALIIDDFAKQFGGDTVLLVIPGSFNTEGSFETGVGDLSADRASTFASNNPTGPSTLSTAQIASGQLAVQQGSKNSANLTMTYDDFSSPLDLTGVQGELTFDFEQVNPGGTGSMDVRVTLDDGTSTDTVTKQISSAGLLKFFSSDFSGLTMTSIDEVQVEYLGKNSQNFIVNSVSAIPEPTTLGLLGFGLCAIGGRRLRRRKSAV